MDDEWRARLAARLLGGNASGAEASDWATFAPEGATVMEIAFGRARSELTYLLELGRANHLPVAGSVTGDVVWVCLGDAEVRFALDRPSLAIVLTTGGNDARFAWDARHRSIATPDGRLVDMEHVVRDALDELVQSFKGGP